VREAFHIVPDPLSRYDKQPARAAPFREETGDA